MVRVPVTAVKWSTWKRYCGTLGISMGRAIAALVEYELCGVVDVAGKEPVFLPEPEQRLGDRKAALVGWERSLEVRERWLRESERRMGSVSLSPPTPAAKVGRSDPCPCRSGLKYKRCQGR